MKHHIAIKFLALLLCAATLALALGCGVALAVLAQYNLFDQNFDEMRQEKLDSAGWDMAYYLAGQYALKNLSNCPQETLYAIGAYNSLESYLYDGYALVFEDGEWFYTIADRTGRLLDSSPVIPEGLKPVIVHKVTYPYPILITYDLLEEPTEWSETAAAEQPDNATVPPVEIPEYEYTSIYYNEEGNAINGYFRRGYSPEYTVSLYLTEDAFPIFAAADWQLLEIAQQNRYYLMVGLIASLVLFAAVFVYLCCAAGRKPGSEEIKPQAFNTLPLDLYAAGGSVCILGLYAIIRSALSGLDYSQMSFLPPVLLIACAVYAVCLIVVGFLYACAAQLKLPNSYWLRHSVTGMACVWGFKVLVGLWHIFVKCCKWIWNTLLPFLKKLLGGLWQKTKRLFTTIHAACVRTFHLLPLTWQWVLVCIFMACILSFAALSHSIWFLLVAIGISLGIILYSSNCFGILHESTKRMSKGDLDTKVSDQFLTGCFKEFAADLNALADVAVVAAEKQMRSERMKAELVTNVSHDIKTPLTSIINYVDLLQKAKTQEQTEEYLEVLERQSLRLKKLIDDLMEMSKASTGNLSVSITQVDAVETVNQSLGEFSDKLAALELTPIFNPPESAVHMRADGRLAWRVLSNLLSNVVKYALPGTRVYIDLVCVEDKVLISLKNISKEQLNVSSEELMERFVRGDASRNTEGSGLGLNIAKSLMELQNGQLQLLVDGDLFKATLIFPAGNG